MFLTQFKSTYLSIYLSILATQSFMLHEKQKGFHIEIYRQIYIYIDIYFCSLARAPVCIYTCYCPTCEKLGSTIDLFFVGFFFSNLKRTYRFEFFVFFRKMHTPCDTNLQRRIIQLILGMRKTSREAADPRVIRRRRIARPNAMASVASEEAFLLMECIKKCAVQERA